MFKGEQELDRITKYECHKQTALNNCEFCCKNKVRVRLNKFNVDCFD